MVLTDLHCSALGNSMEHVRLCLHGRGRVKIQMANIFVFLAIILASSAWLLNPHACCPIEPATNQAEQCTACLELRCSSAILSMACPGWDRSTCPVQSSPAVNVVQTKDTLIGGSDSVPSLSSPVSDFQNQIPFYIAVQYSEIDPHSETTIPLKRPPRII